MDFKQNECQSSTDSMCKGCKLFYGSEVFEGFCSGCFKKNVKTEKSEIQRKNTACDNQLKVVDKIETKQQPTQIATKPVQADRKRCFNCRKKVGLLGIECKCGYVFCNGHRMPEDHACTFDHQNKLKLEKQMVKVYNGKIEQI